MTRTDGELQKLKKRFVAATLVLLLGLVVFLFQTDIVIISNQLAVESGLSTASSQVEVFRRNGGDIEFIPEELEASLQYPSLSEVQAVLKIPRIGIEGRILEGKDEDTLNQGFWHYPSASPFAPNGNVVVIGHRFLKLPPHKDTFYHLDWAKEGDEITIQTEEGTVHYRVRVKQIVNVSDSYVLQPTLNSQLTLVTCHPLWTSDERLVIIADKVVEQYEE